VVLYGHPPAARKGIKIKLSLFRKGVLKMAKLSVIAVDATKSIDGIFVPYYSDIELKIARLNNPKYEKFLQKLIEPHIREIRANNFDRDKRLDLAKQAAAKYLLVDWKNIEDENGKKIPYSPEKALELFRDSKFVDLYNFVIEVANSAEFYRQETKVESIKN
jgi:hypothetical protein